MTKAEQLRQLINEVSEEIGAYAGDAIFTMPDGSSVRVSAKTKQVAPWTGHVSAGNEETVIDRLATAFR
mgnify:CR=1 FL=1